ncbi:NADH-quinone oxidoreductase subunit G [bacterium]|nr:NADH-quinone oxidoreductase subunit G [bacterium]
MVKLVVDGQEVEVPAGATVLQACEAAGQEIPRFCYHERLAIAGNCRMCLVEVERAPKPVASCAMPAGEGMVVKTNSPMVKKAREGVMEFLLINHPLDCPICDQGGECDLQDQAMGYGRGESRFHEHKRAVEEKFMGPLVKTQMTRCIHCTRCVRFAQDVAGVPELGAIGRGEHMEITTYLDQTITSELSGNLVDLCPVGALTSRPYAFRARPWELRPVESIDVLDAVGSNIRVDVRGREVMRILPRIHEQVNEEWISDKTRHACDGLRAQRLDRPYVRKGGKLQPASWEEAFQTIAAKMDGVNPDRVAAIAGDLVEVESMFALKELLQHLRVQNMDCRQDGSQVDAGVPVSYRFNSTIAGVEQADAVLLIGTNPRLEAPLVNTRLRKAYLKSRLKLAAIGEPCELTYPVEWLGNKPELITKGEAVAKFFAKSERPMIIVGQGALNRDDSGAILQALYKLAGQIGLVKDGWNGFNVLHTAAGRVGGLDIGFVPGANGRSTSQILDAAEAGNMDVVFLLGADELDTRRLGKAFVVYQGHHGDAGAMRADVILPGAAYTEKDGTYVNTEGRVQRTAVAVLPPGEAREDWKIIRALSDYLKHPLNYDTLEALRADLGEQYPHLLELDAIRPVKWQAFGGKGAIGNAPFAQVIENFHMTDPISRASKTMAECTRALQQLSSKEAA